MLSGGEVLYLGFPGVVSSSQKRPGRKQPQWLLARPVETSGPLSGPQGLLLPREEEGGWERGKHGEERSDEKKSFFRKTNWPSGNRAEGEDPNRTVSFKGLLGDFCRFSFLFVTLSTS